MDAPAYTPPKPVFPPDSPWERCMTHFLHNIYRHGQSQGSVALYASMLSYFFGGTPDRPTRLPDQVTREDVLAYISSPVRSNRNRGKAPTPATMNMRLSVLKSFYTFASSYEYRDASGVRRLLYDHASPTAGLSSSKTNRAYRALSQAELERLFAAIPTDTVKGLRDRAMFLMYLWTARRRNEIARLTWGDLEEGVIVEANGTRRVGWLYHFRGKGRQMIDDIAELPPLAKQALDQYLEVSGRKATLQADSPLFVSVQRDSTKGLHPGAIERILKLYVRAAGLDERITLHWFRHTAARMRFLAGSSLQDIQHLLRHQSIATTDTYIQGLTGSADPGYKLLEQQFGRFNT